MRAMCGGTVLYDLQSFIEPQLVSWLDGSADNRAAMRSVAPRCVPGTTLAIHLRETLRGARIAFGSTFLLPKGVRRYVRRGCVNRALTRERAGTYQSLALFVKEFLPLSY
jgi:hypothetical protein